MPGAKGACGAILECARQHSEEAPSLHETAANSNGRGRHGQAGRREADGAKCIRDERAKKLSLG